MLTRRKALSLLPASAAIGGSIHSAALAEPSTCSFDPKNSGVIHTVFPIPDHNILLTWIRAKDGYLIGSFLSKVRALASDTSNPSNSDLGDFFSQEEGVTIGKDGDTNSQDNSLAEFVRRAFEFPNPNYTQKQEEDYFIPLIRNTRSVTALCNERYNDLFSRRLKDQLEKQESWKDKWMQDLKKDILGNAATLRKDDRDLLTLQNVDVKDIPGQLIRKMEDLTDKIANYLTKDDGGKTVYQTVRTFPSSGICRPEQGRKYKEHRENLIKDADLMWRRAYLASLFSPRAFLASVQGFVIYYFILKLFDDPNDYVYRERARGRVLNALSISNDFYNEAFSDIRTEASAIRAVINNLELNNFPYLGTVLRHLLYNQNSPPTEPNLPSPLPMQDASAGYASHTYSDASGQSTSLISQSLYTNYYLKAEGGRFSYQAADGKIYNENPDPPYNFKIERIKTDSADKVSSEKVDKSFRTTGGDPSTINKFMNDLRKPALTSKISALKSWNPDGFKKLPDAVPGNDALDRFPQYLAGINGLMNEVSEYYKTVQLIFHGQERLCRSFEILISRGGVRAKLNGKDE